MNDKKKSKKHDPRLLALYQTIGALVTISAERANSYHNTTWSKIIFIVIYLGYIALTCRNMYLYKGGAE